MPSDERTDQEKREQHDGDDPYPTTRPGVKKLMEGVGWAAAVIAGVAAGLAAWFGYQTYRDNHTAFHAEVSLGSPVLRPFTESDQNPHAGNTGKDQTNALLGITIPITFSNTGGSTGCISEVALKIESKSNRTRWIFHPAYMIDIAAYLRNLNVPGYPMKAVVSSVDPVLLPGHQTATRAIWFLPRPVGSAKPLRVSDLGQDRYQFELYVISAKEDCWPAPKSEYEQKSTMEFVLDDRIAKSLQQGDASIPPDQTRETLRNKFFQQ